MGWFWSDSSATDQALPRREASSSPSSPVASAVPPPAACPVKHESACPVKHKGGSSSSSPQSQSWLGSWFESKPSGSSGAGQANQSELNLSAPGGPTAGAAQGSSGNAKAAQGCPVIKKKSGWSLFGTKDEPSAEVNPLNNMPELSSQRAAGQSVYLPTERTLSTIPRGESDSEGVWEYPSPQQMLHAMLRKGGEVPEDAVESMVDVHNFLNEGAWNEITKWEDKYTAKTNIHPRLLKFTGRPDDMSPKARAVQIMGKLFPATFGVPPPFDRHDWTVLRGKENGESDQVRYVIDYYAGPDDEHGMPTFFLDVRPAMDSVNSISDRISTYAGPIWAKAMGRVPPNPNE